VLLFREIKFGALMEKALLDPNAFLATGPSRLSSLSTTLFSV